MATAVEPSSEPRTPSPPMSLPSPASSARSTSSPRWRSCSTRSRRSGQDSIAPQLGGLTFVDVAVRLAVQVAAAGRADLVRPQACWATTPPKGVRGGIFLMISLRPSRSSSCSGASALNFDGRHAGHDHRRRCSRAFLLYLAVRFFTGRRGERWMVALEEQGWFSTVSYKRSLGQKVRRLTILGILLIGGTGVYSLMFQGLLPRELDARDAVRAASRSRVLTDAQYADPAAADRPLTLWFAWRAVNVPTSPSSSSPPRRR